LIVEAWRESGRAAPRLTWTISPESRRAVDRATERIDAANDTRGSGDCPLISAYLASAVVSLTEAVRAAQSGDGERVLG